MEHKVSINDDIRTRLLNEARIIFARFGYNKTTVDEIAKAVGKGKSSFYYYFSSKEEIFKAVIDHEAFIFRTKLIESISVEASPLQKIKNYVLTRLENFKELVNFYNAVRNDGMTQISFIDEVRNKYEMEQQNIIKMILVESVHKKLIEINDIELVTEAMAEILKGLEYYLMFNTKAVGNLKDKIDGVLNLVFKGIGK